MSSDQLARMNGWAILAFTEAVFLMALCWMLANAQSPIVLDGCTVIHPKTEARP
mgnify:CR=1 FL=1